MTFTTFDVSQVPNIARYRRPNLVYSSGTVVTLETGLDGTSGDAVILFPDGNLRTETSSSRYNMTISQNAVFTNATLGSNQGGLRTGTVSNNTWYALYAVKVTTFTANWVLVADTVLPLQANYSTLNTNFGTNGWVYLGVLPYGDNAGAPSAIPLFDMSGNKIVFANNCTTQSDNMRGVVLATASSVTTLSWSYAAGTSLSSGQVPNQFVIGDFHTLQDSSTRLTAVQAAHTSVTYVNVQGMTSNVQESEIADIPLAQGLELIANTTANQSILLTGYIDPVLGVGSNPLL